MIRRSMLYALRLVGVGTNPKLRINQVNTMAVGDADQLLGYTSNSSGAVSFASSDISKATIVVTGGNSYLHSVAAGDITVTVSQVAASGYAAASNSTAFTTVAATTVDDITYSTLAAGKAATADGSRFNVPNANTFTLRKYLMVSGKAVYQSTIPAASMSTAIGVKNKIYSTDLGVMPATPLFDFDSSYAAFTRNIFANINGVDEGEKNIVRYGHYTTDNNTYGGAAITEVSPDVWQVVFPNPFGSPCFAYFLNTIVPAGVWTMAFDIKLASGSPRTVSIGPKFSGGGTGYVPFTLSTDYQTASILFENDVDTAYGYGGLISAADISGGDVSTAGFTILVTNIRLIPGTSVVNALVSHTNVILNNGLDSIADGLNGDLSFRVFDAVNSGNTDGNALLYQNTTDLSACTMIYAVKLPPTTGPGKVANVLLSAVGLSEMVVGYDYINQEAAIFGGAGGKQDDYKLDDGRWSIMAFTQNGTEQSMFYNGVKVADVVAAPIVTDTTNRIYFAGKENYGFKGNGYISGITLWDRGLSDSEVLAATNIYLSRMRLKNHFLDLSNNTYCIFEGDSITAWSDGYLSYARRLRQAYATQLYGFNAARGGASLGGLSSPNGGNTLYGRKAWVSSSISTAVANGYNVVLSIFIGANDLPALLSSGDVSAYYSLLMAYIADMRALGAKVILGTLIDRGSVTDKTYLIELNGLITGDTTKYDRLVDLYANAAFNTATTTNYNTDLLHPNDTGQAEMETLFKPALDSLIV